jgi:Cys-tRNA(Pro)/Cys-tRNA(Cys) deacylase
MAKEKNIKTNAMRILDTLKIPYEVKTYECDEFIDGMSVAEKLNQDPEQCFKTLVTQGKSGNYYVFVLPVAEELDLKKCAVAAGEKSVEMIHVKDINKITGYIRGGCTAIGMKKQYPTFVHTSAEDFETIMVSAGKIGMQLILSPADLVKAANGKFEDFIK